jgi:hypothetical protein
MPYLHNEAMEALIKMSAKEKRQAKISWLSVLLYVLPLVVVVGGAIWWASGIDREVHRIPEIEKKVDDLTARMGEVANTKGTAETIQIVSRNYSIGLINEKLAKDNQSSFGLPYELDYNICETNVSSDRWNELGGLPYVGQFLKISNSYNKYESWCMNIGQFSDFNNPNRLLIVAPKVGKDLNLTESIGTIVGRIELIPDDEWKKDSGKVMLHDQVYGLK